MEFAKASLVVALALLLTGCQSIVVTVAPETTSPLVSDDETGETLVCHLSNGTGVLTATHAIVFPEGW